MPVGADRRIRTEGKDCHPYQAPFRGQYWRLGKVTGPAAGKLGPKGAVSSDFFVIRTPFESK